MSTQESRNRKDNTIEVHVCDICFVSTPVNQAENHAQWHATKPIAAVVDR